MKTVLMIGLHPDAVHYDRWPGLTPEKLLGGLKRDQEALAAAGYHAEVGFIDNRDTAEDMVRAKLAERVWDCILIGAGVRKDDNEFIMFERLVNVLHEAAPQARICFNTGPTDSVDAVRRWI